MTGGAKERQAGALIAAALSLILLAVGLSGCTDDSPPTPPATQASPHRTPTPSPAASPPASPEAAQTAKGAEAFVGYFWKVYNYSYQTGVTNDFEQIVSHGCAFCNDTISAINGLSDEGSHIEGSQIELTVAIAPPSDPRLGLIVETVISERPGKTIGRNGAVIATTTGVRNMKSEIAVDWNGKKWIVRDVANDEGTGKPW
jgi:Family of unknown function (DUF6318)